MDLGGAFLQLAAFTLAGLVVIMAVGSLPSCLPARRQRLLKELGPNDGDGRLLAALQIVDKWRPILALASLLAIVGTVLRLAG